MTQKTNWEVVVNGITLRCNYWPIEANENRIMVAVPLAAPDRVCGSDCYDYVDGVRQDARYWKDYPEDEDPDNPNNFYTLRGGQPHPPHAGFEVSWVGDWVHGQPTSSPFTLRDPNLDALCDYDHYFEWKDDGGKTHRSGPSTVLKPEVARAVYQSLLPRIERSGDLKTRALVEAGRVPAGVRKEEHLPFVEAVLRWLDAEQAEALEADNTAHSFRVAGEQLQYRDDYERLTGRKWEGDRQ